MYVGSSRQGHICHDLARCLELRCNLLEHGTMLPDLDMSEFGAGPG